MFCLGLRGNYLGASAESKGSLGKELESECARQKGHHLGFLGSKYACNSNPSIRGWMSTFKDLRPRPTLVSLLTSSSRPARTVGYITITSILNLGLVGVRLG